MHHRVFLPCGVLVLSTVLLADEQTPPVESSAGPYLLKDINPNGSSNPGGFVAFSGLTCFSADDGVHGPELWRTDGSEAGTALVSDINPGNLGSAPQLTPTIFGGRLYFAATSPLGRELWSANGSAEGTTLVADINAGPPDGDPGVLLPIGKTLFFRAQDASGLELWKTDGTATGTALVADIDPAEGSIPTFLTELDGLVYFGAHDKFTPGIGFDRELWRTDGTAEGTVRVKDINPGPAPSIPSQLIRLGNRILFQAGEPTAGVELWIHRRHGSGHCVAV